MSIDFQAALLSWSIPVGATLALDIAAIVYVRGWMAVRKTRRELFPLWRLFCFLFGLLAIFLAIASPLDVLDDQLLSAHMAQHFLFMNVAPPLLLLSYPQVPLLRGLPRVVIRRVLGPLLRMRWLRKVGSFLTRLKVAWLAMNLAYIGWHIPAAYELALRSQNWHEVEHACFFLTSLLFWWPILRPWPNHGQKLRWMLLPYLLAADLVNTGLSSFLCFSGRAIYPTYVAARNILGVSALNDQVAAGAFMWVFSSTIFLPTAFWLTTQLLSSSRRARQSYIQTPRPEGAGY